MEYDRYKEHHKLYIMGIICLVLCLGFLFFSLYILPFLIWGLHYDTPELITNLVSFFQYNYQLTYRASATLTWLIFFIPSVITGIVSYYASNSIDNELLEVPIEDEAEGQLPPATTLREDMKESTSLGLKILFLMIVVVLAVLLIQALL